MAIGTVWLVRWWVGGYTPLHASITADVPNEEGWGCVEADIEP